MAFRSRDPGADLASLTRHELDVEQRIGFAYAVLLTATAEYLRCVYFSPPRSAEFDVDVRSWVRQERAELDKQLHDCVRAWLAAAWPWTAPDYAVR